MKPYPAYRDSGLPWLGAIPAHWQIGRLKDHATIVNGYPFDSDLFNPTEGTPLIRIRDLLAGTTETRYMGEEVSTAIVDNSDILVGMDGDYNCCWWQGGRALLNQRLCCIRPRSGLQERYMFYLLPYPLKLLNDLTWYTTVKHLSSLEVGAIRLPFPPRAEQDAIVAYLDRKLAEIDRFIAAKQRLIALLKAQKAAVINRAVTRGLDQSVPMKPSGIEWLGDIPAHWEAERTKFVARLESGHTPSRQRPEYWENCTIPWISLADVWQLRDRRREYVEDTNEYVSELGIANSSARLLPSGTVIVSRTASVGFSGIMARPMATTQDFANWVCGPRILPEYLLYVFRAMDAEFRRLVMGSTHQTIYMPDIGTFSTPVPPISEQVDIVRHVRRLAAETDLQVDNAEREIELMRELRTTLISDAVTGKIDVRDAVDSSSLIPAQLAQEVPV